MAGNSQREFKDVIEQVLEEVPAARDNDWILFGGVIKRLRGLDYMKNTSLYDFLIQAAEDPSIPKPTTPTRYRCNMQKQNSELRGELYEARRAHSNDWRDEFGSSKG